MKKGIKDLKGSPFRDEWRFRHKQEKYYSSKYDRDRCWGLDIDFIEGRGNLPVAIIDLHDEKEILKEPTWSEKQIYPILGRALGIPVFMVESNEKFSPIWVTSWPDERFVARYADFEDYTKNFTEKIEEIIKNLHL